MTAVTLVTSVASMLDSYKSEAKIATQRKERYAMLEKR